MKRMILGVLAGGALASVVTIAIVLAFFTGVQNTSGTISMATVGSGENLYICDARVDLSPGLLVVGSGGSAVTLPSGQTIWCNEDDSGPDETIFETQENLLPGSTATWDIYLWNVGGSAFDLTDFPNDIQIAKVTDPGNACNVNPRIDASIIFGAPFGAGPASSTRPIAGDDPPPPPGFAGYLLEGTTDHFVPHLEPGSGEVMRLRVIVDPSVGNECSGTEWSISVGWGIVGH